jgi:hypothetical protein
MLRQHIRGGIIVEDENTSVIPLRATHIFNADVPHGGIGNKILVG